MLSKFIYRFLAIAFLAFSTQVGFSQNYVDAEQALVILEDAIEHLQTEVDNGPADTGLLQSISVQENDKISLQLMKTVQKEIDELKDTKAVMDDWYEKAESEAAERKTKLILALDKVKVLLT